MFIWAVHIVTISRECCQVILYVMFWVLSFSVDYMNILQCLNILKHNI